MPWSMPLDLLYFTIFQSQLCHGKAKQVAFDLFIMHHYQQKSL
jgi:hypothetical protein